MSHVVIAIDGPAASGKSSVARALAHAFDFAYVNTGAMYRAATWYILSKDIDPADTERVGERLSAAKIECGLDQAKESTIRLDGVDPTPHLRDPLINQHVSAVSMIARVRERLVTEQRAYADRENVVMEGRDIGSAVFPQTPYKFYIDASPEVRARRRSAQGESDSVTARDSLDSTRRISPLMIAKDAQVIDSSKLTIEGVVGEIIGRLKLKDFPLPATARLTRL
jgi:cytidylate kinase